ncbi:MAG: hypothetical protein AB4062_14575 [Crocosphaera sp.]
MFKFAKREDGEKIEIGCVVPLQRKTLAVGTLKSILNQAQVTVETFLDNL